MTRLTGAARSTGAVLGARDRVLSMKARRTGTSRSMPLYGAHGGDAQDCSFGHEHSGQPGHRRQLWTITLFPGPALT
jgi:hypothetical protein